MRIWATETVSKCVRLDEETGEVQIKASPFWTKGDRKKGREVGSLPLDQHGCPSLSSTSESGAGVK